MTIPTLESRDTATTVTVTLLNLAKALHKSPSSAVSLFGVQVTKELRRLTSHQVALMAKPTEVCPVLILKTPHVAIGSTSHFRNANTGHKEAIWGQTSRSNFNCSAALSPGDQADTTTAFVIIAAMLRRKRKGTYT